MKGDICDVCAGDRWRGRKCLDCTKEIPQSDDPRWVLWAHALELRGRRRLIEAGWGSRKLNEIEAWGENENGSEIEPDACKRLLRALISSALLERDVEFLTEIVGVTTARARTAIQRAREMMVTT